MADLFCILHLKRQHFILQIPAIPVEFMFTCLDHDALYEKSLYCTFNFTLPMMSHQHVPVTVTGLCRGAGLHV